MLRPLIFKKRLLQCLGSLMGFIFLFEAYGVAIDHAKITEVVNDVGVLNPDSRHTTPAKTDGVVHTPDIMKTGADSRSEMVADDQTVTRVGANTLFSFEPKERVINLKQGSVLFQSPSGKGGGTIRTAAATASVLGTTIIVVYTKGGGFKLLVLEGTGRLTMPNGKIRILHSGQLIVVPPGAQIPGPILTFLLSNEVNTSLLVRGFKRPLPSWSLILAEILKQEKEIANGQLQGSTNVVGNPANPNTRINQIQGLHANATPIIQSTPVPTPRPSLPGASPKGRGKGGSTGLP